MSTLKQILEKRGMLLCSGCGMQMRPQQGACPDCGVSYGFGMGAKDASDMSEAKTEEEPTTDFKLDKAGRKIKASKIIFNKGEDDSTKKVQEDMKTTYKELDEKTAPWETDAEAAKREKEKSNFKKPSNPARGGMETAKALAQKGLKKANANEELKGKQHKIDKNKNGKVDAHDFKLLRKEDAEQIEEAIHADDYTATSEKSQFGGHRPHVVNKETGKTMHLSAQAYKSPEHAKAHAKAYLTGYAKLGMHAADRASIDYAKANKEHMVKEEDMNEELHPAASKVLKHIKPEHHAKYTPDMTTKHYTGNFADRKAVLDAAQKAGHLKEASPFDWKNTPRQTSDKTKTSTYHDVKKISTGTVYTKQFDKDGTSKGTGDDAAKKAEGAVKRGRGRPKKDKFAESVEMLMSLSEDQFDSMMEEGFDAFFEAYEELDELSKATLGSYAKKAARDSTITRKIASDFEHMSDRARTPGMKQAAGMNAQNYKERSWKRRDGADKAIDKLTK